MKKTIQRLLSGILAFAMVLGLLGGVGPVVLPKAQAADNAIPMNGLYTITSAVNGKVLAPGDDYKSKDANDAYVASTYRLKTPEGTNEEYLIVQADNVLRDGANTTYPGLSLETYGIRAVDVNVCMYGTADSDTVIQKNANYRNNNNRWRLIPSGEDFYILFVGDPQNSDDDRYLYTPDGSSVKLSGTGATPNSSYRWKLERKHIPSTMLAVGSYWLEPQKMVDDASVANNSGQLNTVSHVICYSSADNKPVAKDIAKIGNQHQNTYAHYVIQPISGGAYSIVNSGSGKYLKLNDDNTVTEGQYSSQKPVAAERWYIVPATMNGNTSDGAALFRIISCVNGLQLRLGKSFLTAADSATTVYGLVTEPYNNLATQTWYLKDVRAYQEWDNALGMNVLLNAQKGDTQSTSTGVYADTFDETDTVSLPIKIFDYAADGMLFEYASNTADDKFHLDADGNQQYRLGNNLSFGMVSRSDGGSDGLDWDNVNYGDVRYPGYGSNSFDYNKYWSPYISGLRLNNNKETTDLSYVVADTHTYFFTGTAMNPAVLISAGTMNTTTAGVDYTGSTEVAGALGYPMFAQQTFGNATMGLLESGLVKVTVGGQEYTLPRYRQHTVEFIAMILQRALEINPVGDGVANYNYVDGETSFADLTSGLDLAALLRGDTKADISNIGVLAYEDGSVLNTRFAKYGTYAETLAKSENLIGSWSDVKEHIDTCMDAAYWMLNSIFLENSYNQPQDRYTSLVLTKVTDQDGKEGYIFDSTFIDSASSVNVDGNRVGFTAVEYNTGTGTIRNTSAAGKSYTYWGMGNSAATYSFTPVRTADGDKNSPKGTQTTTDTPYILDGGILNSAYSDDPGVPSEYEGRNFNFVLQSNGNFVYHEEDQLFFEFEGDDDVYLFINGQIVLDIGGAHTVTGTQMNVNDYVHWARALKNDEESYNALSDTMKQRVNALAINEGDKCTFDFYYMERHGYGSNMRIFTNIRVSSTDIETTKQAYQEEVEGSLSDTALQNDTLEYCYTLTNNTAADLPNLYFSDADNGLSFRYDTGMTLAENAPLRDHSGGALTESDLYVTVIGSDGARYPVNLTQTTLTAVLADVSQDSGTGLPVGWSIEIRGIYHQKGSPLLSHNQSPAVSGNAAVARKVYQGKTEVLFDGVVSRTESVEYSFTIRNTSNHNLYCLSYTDADIGIYIGYDKGLDWTARSYTFLQNSDGAKVSLVTEDGETEVVNLPQLSDRNGGTLDAGDLIVTLIKDDGTRIPVDLSQSTNGANMALRRLLSDVPYMGVSGATEYNGLQPGWSIEIRGIYYRLTNDQMDEGSFLNEVRGAAWTGINSGDTNGDNEITVEDMTPSGATIYDDDDIRIRFASRPRYYQWRGHELTITRSRFIQDVKDVTNYQGEYLYPTINEESVTALALSTSLGTAPGPDITDYVKLDGEKFTFTYDTTGAHVFFVKVSYLHDGILSDVLVPVQVFVTDMVNSVYVLDYGLEVDLSGVKGLFEKDVTVVNDKAVFRFQGVWDPAVEGGTEEENNALKQALPSYANNNITAATGTYNDKPLTSWANTVTGKDIPGTYGTYRFVGETLKYTPTAFMEGADTVWVSGYVSEDPVNYQSGAVNENVEVAMYKSVTVLPANVVYYEDTFTAIHYDKRDDAENPDGFTIEVIGTLSGDVTPGQSPDQSFDYGYEEGAYATDSNVQMSHGSVTKITIDKVTYEEIRDGEGTVIGRTPIPAATFSFYGTGFELVSRTNATDSATVMLQLVYPDGVTVKNIPVITEFNNNAGGDDSKEAIYQVPVVRVEGQRRQIHRQNHRRARL